jgi:hypothetical protein
MMSSMGSMLWGKAQQRANTDSALNGNSSRLLGSLEILVGVLSGKSLVLKDSLLRL